MVCGHQLRRGARPEDLRGVQCLRTPSVGLHQRRRRDVPGDGGAEFAGHIFGAARPPVSHHAAIEFKQQCQIPTVVLLQLLQVSASVLAVPHADGHDGRDLLAPGTWLHQARAQADSLLVVVHLVPDLPTRRTRIPPDRLVQ